MKRSLMLLIMVALMAKAGIYLMDVATHSMVKHYSQLETHTNG